MVAAVQTPLLSWTRYHVFCVKFVCVSAFAAFVVSVGVMTVPIFVQVVLTVDCCHWMLPTLPLASVRVAALVPVHTAIVPLIVLLTTAGLTVIENVFELTEGHGQLVTVAL